MTQGKYQLLLAIDLIRRKHTEESNTDVLSELNAHYDTCNNRTEDKHRTPSPERHAFVLRYRIHDILHYAVF
jgi:hypothetical protein